MGFWRDMWYGRYMVDSEESKPESKCKAKETYSMLQEHMDEAIAHYRKFIELKPISLYTPDKFENDIVYQRYCLLKVAREEQLEKALVEYELAKLHLTRVFYTIPMPDTWFKIIISDVEFGISDQCKKPMPPGTYIGGIYGLCIRPWSANMTYENDDFIFEFVHRTEIAVVNDRVINKFLG